MMVIAAAPMPSSSSLSASEEEEQRQLRWRAYALLMAPRWMKGQVQVQLSGPELAAAIRAAALYHGAGHAESGEGKELLARLLRSRLRLVRAELAAREGRRRPPRTRLYFSPEEIGIVKEGLDAMPAGDRAGLTGRFTVLARAGVKDTALERRRIRSEIVSAMNVAGLAGRGAGRRGRGPGLRASNKGGTAPPAARRAPMRMRFREWTVRSAIFAVAAYMRYDDASSSGGARLWAYRFLGRLVALQREVIAAQVRRGRRPPAYWTPSRGSKIEPAKLAYITPSFSIREISAMRKGLELMRAEAERRSEEEQAAGRPGRWRTLDPTEAVLLRRTTALYGAYYGDAWARRQVWDWRR